MRDWWSMAPTWRYKGTFAHTFPDQRLNYRPCRNSSGLSRKQYPLHPWDQLHQSWQGPSLHQHPSKNETLLLHLTKDDGIIITGMCNHENPTIKVNFHCQWSCLLLNNMAHLALCIYSNISVLLCEVMAHVFNKWSSDQPFIWGHQIEYLPCCPLTTSLPVGMTLQSLV